MKFIKSILAVAAAVFIGSSAWADQNVEVQVDKTITITSQSEVSANSQWKVDWNNDQSRSEIKNPSDNGFTIDGDYQTKSTAGKVQFTVTGYSQTATNNPVVLRLKKKSSSGGNSTVLEKIYVTVVAAAPADGETTLDLAYGQSATVTTSASISSISPALPAYVTVSRNGTTTTFTAKSTTGSEVIQLKDSSGKLIKKVTVNVTDPSQKSVSLYFGEVAEFTLTNAQNVSWTATASGNVRLMTAATTAATSQNASSTRSFTIKINGYTAGGSGTVIVKRGQTTVMTYNCTVTADIDEDTDGGYNSVVAARKQLTLYKGEPLTLTYYKTSKAKWRFVDAEITSAMFTDRSQYTYKELGVFKASTSKDYTYSKGSSGTASASANLTSDTSSDFDAKVEGVQVGKGSLAVCSGSNQPSHYAAYYEVTVYQPIAVPTGATLTYNGNTQTGVASGTGYTVSGMASAKNAGTYQAIVTPNQYYCWPDHSTDAKVVEWTIAAKSATVTADPKSMTQGGQVPALTYTSTGLVSTDKFMGALACAVTSASPAGEYPITIGTLTNANYAITYIGAVVTVINPRTKINYPTPATGLVYGFTNQVGVAEGPYYTLSGIAVTNTVGTHTAYATPDKDHCWQDGTYGAYQIDWSIGYRPATVTVVSTNKLFGAEEPVYQTKNEGFIATDPTELTWTVWRTNASETVGTYDVLVAGEEFKGGYQISYNKGTLTIEAGVVTVNGKGYNDLGAAFADLKANGGTATFNKAATYNGYEFAQGATLEYDTTTELLSVTGDITVPKIEASEQLEVNGTLTLKGDIFVGATGAVDTLVVATNVVLGANVTVGAESEGATDAMAILAFEEIDVGEYKLTLTTNGVVQSATQLTIADVFADAPTGFRIIETQIDGGFEYALEALNVVEVPTAVDGLVYNGTEQTGVEEGEGYTLEANTATDAGSYTATATLADGYIWADGKTEQKTIGWSIGKLAITVTPVATNKLVGAEDPELTYTTNVEPVEGDEFTGKLVRSEGEDVGTYDITQGTLAIDDGNEGKNYDLTFNTASGADAFEIKAGVINVNGKGYATVEEAFAALVLAAKSGTATATFNEEVEAQGYKFAQGAVLTIEQGGVWTVTGDVTMPMVEKEKKVSVDGALTLAGDIFVGDRADVTTEVLATNVVLAANVTVGAATKGFEPAGIATLAFGEIDVGDYKLTLTTNGVVQSATALDIDAVFAEVEHFEVVENPIEGGFEYTLEATEFYVKYYDGDEVVHSNKFTILNYMTDLHIWNGDRKDLVLLGYTREDKVTPLAVSDEALRAYVKDEADKSGCDGEVKVLGTWKKATITIKIVMGEGVDDVQTNGVSVVGDLELPADATEVELELVKDVDLTIPVFKVITNDVTNVTQSVETYAVVEGLTYTFIAEEAEYTDPDVTEKQVKDAIIDAIDEENREVVAPKIDAVVDTNETPAPGKVSAKDMATWITENEIQSFDMKDSNYLAASVNLDTSAPITDAAEVKFVEVEEDTSTGFTFDFELKLSGKETPEELEVEAAKLAGYIQTTGDLGTGFNGKTVGTDRVMIDPDTGKVTITPDPTKSAEFFKIVIPQDPGEK